MLILKLKTKEEATVYLEKHRLAILRVEKVSTEKKKGLIAIRTTDYDERFTVTPGSTVFKQLTPDYYINFTITQIASGKLAIGVNSSKELKIYRNCLTSKP